MLYFGFGSIEEEFIFIAVLSVILVILLAFEHWQKQLEKRQEYLEDFIYDIRMLIKHMYKRLKKRQQKGADE